MADWAYVSGKLSLLKWVTELLCLGEEGEIPILLNQLFLDDIDLFPNVRRV